jgi:YD repeat-containing protein
MITGFPRKRTTATALLLAGLFASPSQAATASISYTYDALGRVTTALYDNGACVVYTYDAVGNRTSQTNTTAGGPGTPTWGTGSWGCFQWAEEESGLPPHGLAALDQNRRVLPMLLHRGETAGEGRRR